MPAGVSLKDLAHVGLLLGLALPAWFLPKTTWPACCSAMGRLTWNPARRRRIRRALGGAVADREVFRISESIASEGLLGRIYLLHEYRVRPRTPTLELVGAGHIDAALARGRGAILWVSPFRHSDLMTKRTLREAGYTLTHLSRPEHGGGHTRFGIRFVSPVYQAIENRYLGTRLLLRGGGVAALRQLVVQLGENALVSIAALETALRTVQVPFLETSIRLARGPVALAHRSGAPLLPVFTLRTGVDRFRTVVLPPLTVADADGVAPFEQYARALEERVRAFPGQWVGWRSLVTPHANQSA